MSVVLALQVTGVFEQVGVEADNANKGRIQHPKDAGLGGHFAINPDTGGSFGHTGPRQTEIVLETGERRLVDCTADLPIVVSGNGNDFARIVAVGCEKAIAVMRLFVSAVDDIPQVK